VLSRLTEDFIQDLTIVRTVTNSLNQLVYEK